jgi:protein gp37
MLEGIDLKLHDYAMSGSTHSVSRAFLHWIICGCESGPNARPMDLDWARDLRDQCQAAGVPFFLKQAMIMEVGENAKLDGKIWDEYPEV